MGEVDRTEGGDDEDREDDDLEEDDGDFLRLRSLKIFRIITGFSKMVRCDFVKNSHTAKMSAFFGVCYFEENKTESVILNNANDGETLIANECDDDVVNVIFGESEIQSARFCSYIQFFSLSLFSNCAIQEI